MATVTRRAAANKKPKSKAKKESTLANVLEPEKAAAVALLPSINAAAVVSVYTKPTFGEQDIVSLTTALSTGMDELFAGDMNRAEAMLYSQAHALQAIFVNLARRAASQEYLKQWETYLRMAMKAQNQCRMTLETLATIKNPPVLFARQANINNGGQQQVNNGPAPNSTPASAHPRETASRPNELLEDLTHGGTQLDNRATAAAGRKSPSLDPVGAVKRPANR